MPLNPPDAKELKALIDWANLTDDVRELSIKVGDVELFISRDRQRPAAQPGAAASPASPAPAAPAAAGACVAFCVLSVGVVPPPPGRLRPAGAGAG